MFFSAVTLKSAVGTETLTYEFHGKTFESTFAFDRSMTRPRGAVLIVPNWMGPSEYFTRMAKTIADQGYTAMVADIYGVDVRPTEAREASQAAGDLRSGDRTELRERAAKALEVLRGHRTVDASKIVAIGFCFGGGTVLEMARDGAEIRAAISLHGNLDSPRPAESGDIRCKVYAFHGAADPYVPDEDVEAFVQEMRQAGADWSLMQFGGVVHSFTNPNANSEGSRYDPTAARQSWALMRDVFDQELR